MAGRFFADLNGHTTTTTRARECSSRTGRIAYTRNTYDVII
jgi:hypothetical protein